MTSTPARPQPGDGGWLPRPDTSLLGAAGGLGARDAHQGPSPSGFDGHCTALRGTTAAGRPEGRPDVASRGQSRSAGFHGDRGLGLQQRHSLPTGDGLMKTRGTAAAAAAAPSDGIARSTRPTPSDLADPAVGPITRTRGRGARPRAAAPARGGDELRGGAGKPAGPLLGRPRRPRTRRATGILSEPAARRPILGIASPSSTPVCAGWSPGAPGADTCQRSRRASSNGLGLLDDGGAEPAARSARRAAYAEPCCRCSSSRTCSGCWRR